jgi:hypothetical protein
VVQGFKLSLNALNVIYALKILLNRDLPRDLVSFSVQLGGDGAAVGSSWICVSSILQITSDQTLVTIPLRTIMEKQGVAVKYGLIRVRETHVSPPPRPRTTSFSVKRNLNDASTRNRISIVKPDLTTKEAKPKPCFMTAVKRRDSDASG